MNPFRRLWTWLGGSANQLSSLQAIIGAVGSLTAMLGAAFVFFLPNLLSDVSSDNVAVVTISLEELEAREEELRELLDSERKVIRDLEERISAINASLENNDERSVIQFEQDNVSRTENALENTPSCAPNIRALTDLGDGLRSELDQQLGQFWVLLDSRKPDVSNEEALCSLDSADLQDIYRLSLDGSRVLGEKIDAISNFNSCASDWVDYIDNFAHTSPILKSAIISEVDHNLRTVARSEANASIVARRLEDNLRQIEQIINLKFSFCEP